MGASLWTGETAKGRAGFGKAGHDGRQQSTAGRERRLRFWMGHGGCRSRSRDGARFPAEWSLMTMKGILITDATLACAAPEIEDVIGLRNHRRRRRRRAVRMSMASWPPSCCMCLAGIAGSTLLLLTGTFLRSLLRSMSVDFVAILPGSRRTTEPRHVGTVAVVGMAPA